MADRELLRQLGLAVVDAIADDGCRNAAGGIYATRVQEFAREVQRAFAQQNGLLVPGLTVCRSDGRCQYAIDHGAEGLGHCPQGKCAMPEEAGNG
jgi:hypothetical protein